MRKKNIEFDAHEIVKRPTRVSFKTREGERVRFIAEKPTRVPTHVRFEAK